MWKGMLDDISIWNVPLSEEKVRSLMFQRLGGNEPGLVAYYGFNEGSGDVLHDQSPNQIHGKIYGDKIQWVKNEEKELLMNACPNKRFTF
jgi:hypothetical protein